MHPWIKASTKQHSEWYKCSCMSTRKAFRNTDRENIRQHYQLTVHQYQAGCDVSLWFNTAATGRRVLWLCCFYVYALCARILLSLRFNPFNRLFPLVPSINIIVFPWQGRVVPLAVAVRSRTVTRVAQNCMSLERLELTWIFCHAHLANAHRCDFLPSACTSAHVRASGCLNAKSCSQVHLQAFKSLQNWVSTNKVPILGSVYGQV